MRIDGVVSLGLGADGRGEISGVLGAVGEAFTLEPKLFIFLPAGDRGDADGGGRPCRFVSVRVLDFGFLRGEPRDNMDRLREALTEGSEDD